jgi:hypothetical protein
MISERPLHRIYSLFGEFFVTFSTMGNHTVLRDHQQACSVLELVSGQSAFLKRVA